MKSPHLNLPHLLATAARAPLGRPGEPTTRLEAAVLRAWRLGLPGADEAKALPLIRHAAIGAACALAVCAAWFLLPSATAAGPAPSGLVGYALNVAWTP